MTYHSNKFHLFFLTQKGITSMFKHIIYSFYSSKDFTKTKMKKKKKGKKNLKCMYFAFSWNVNFQLFNL